VGSIHPDHASEPVVRGGSCHAVMAKERATWGDVIKAANLTLEG
jgi:hypothetical protein